MLREIFAGWSLLAAMILLLAGISSFGPQPHIPNDVPAGATLQEDARDLG
jgi:hypothetical protein